MFAHSFNFVEQTFFSIVCVQFFLFLLFLLEVSVVSLFNSIVIGTDDVIGGHDIVGFTVGGVVIGAKANGGGESDTAKPNGTGNGKGIGNDKVERGGIGEGGRKEVFEEDEGTCCEVVREVAGRIGVEGVVGEEDETEAVDANSII